MKEKERLVNINGKSVIEKKIRETEREVIQKKNVRYSQNHRR